MGTYKFVIDGEIEGQPEVTSLNKRHKPKISRMIVGLWSSLCVCFILIIALVYLINKLNGVQKKANKLYILLSNNTRLLKNNDSLQTQIDKLTEVNNVLTENLDSSGGVFFEVQIGNFIHFDLDAYVNELEVLRQEKSGKGTKLILGRFRSFNKATLFEKDVKKMGFTNAFIIGRINGKLVNYQEALAACQNEGNDK